MVRPKAGSYSSPMKHLGLLLLGLAGLALAWIAWRAEDPTYSAPVADPEPPAVVPATLSGDVKADMRKNLAFVRSILA